MSIIVCRLGSGRVVTIPAPPGAPARRDAPASPAAAMAPPPVPRACRDNPPPAARRSSCGRTPLRFRLSAPQSCRDASEIAGFRAAVLKVRIHLPPAKSLLRTRFATQRSTTDDIGPRQGSPRPRKAFCSSRVQNRVVGSQDADPTRLICGGFGLRAKVSLSRTDFVNLVFLEITSFRSWAVGSRLSSTKSDCREPSRLGDDPAQSSSRRSP